MMSHLVAGLAFLAFGIALVLAREQIFQQCVTAHEQFWGRLGVPSGSERVNRILTTTVVLLLATCTVIAGLGELYTAATGRDWPLRYGRWGDLWPF
jgi:hypothetical protein